MAAVFLMQCSSTEIYTYIHSEWSTWLVLLSYACFYLSFFITLCLSLSLTLFACVFLIFMFSKPAFYLSVWMPVSLCSCEFSFKFINKFRNENACVMRKFLADWRIESFCFEVCLFVKFTEFLLKCFWKN